MSAIVYIKTVAKSIIYILYKFLIRMSKNKFLKIVNIYR